MFWLYNALLTLFSPLWVPWMLWRANRRAEKVDWKQRTGEYHLQLRKGAPRVWFHAVSVGEVVAALPILREIRSNAPEAEIVLSVTTSSGHSTAEKQAAGLYDHLVYFPIDVPRFCLAAIATVKPKVVAIMETELWFNFMWAAKVIDAQTLLLNGRISDRSFPRAKLLRFFYKSLLANVDRALMQSETDRERIQALGACSAEVFGNCKFDQAVEEPDFDPDLWRTELGIDATRPIIVIGSTRGEFEEEFVVEALRDPRLHEAQIVHAPRHLETADALESRVARAFGRAARRSRGESGRYLILDTYGELAKTYSIATVAVVGGGFAKLGGQNLIQPLAWGKPVIYGPHMANFRDVSQMAHRAGATRIVETPSQLADSLAELIANPGLVNDMGERARKLVAENRGASARYAKAITDVLSNS